MHGNRTGKADNDNVKQRVNEVGEIPISPDERRVAPYVEAASGMGWFCLVTLPQHEYRCSDALSDVGTPSYVPTRTFWERRRKGKDAYLTELQQPLFRGYVFAHLPAPVWRVDATGARYPVLPSAWDVTKRKAGANASPIGVLGCLGNHGHPIKMPIRYRDAEGSACGLASLADEEREGWFDDRKRSFLEALREKGRAEAERLASMPPIAKGETVNIVRGALAGSEAVALNDNNESRRFKIMREFMGTTRVVELSVDDVENTTRPAIQLAQDLRRA